MKMTVGKRIAFLRKQTGFTQDELANKLNVSPQAISKWENDLSCPDIMLLPKLAKLFGTTVDELLTDQSENPETFLIPEEKRKKLDDMVFKVVVNSSEGDKVRVNLPMPLDRIGLEMGLKLPQLTENEKIGEIIRTVNVQQIFEMVEKGVVGKLVEVESAQGDVVEIWVE